MKPIIYQPFDSSLIVQKFGENLTPYYAAHGLKGHTGIDYAAPWGASILQCLEGAFVYSTMHKDDQNLANYRAVFTMWDDPHSDISYEISYGHCNDITAQVGTTPKIGNVIASVGNTGHVAMNGVVVTEDAKLAGSRDGAHLHFQVRKCQRVPYTDNSMQLVQDGNGVLILNGMYYKVVHYKNGYNGCVDPELFISSVLAKDVPQYIALNQTLLATLQKMVVILWNRIIIKK